MHTYVILIILLRNYEKAVSTVSGSQLDHLHLKVHSASIAASRISLAISLHFVWISSTNFSFFIFQCFTQKFKFFNLKSYWILKYLHTQEFQRATAHLNVWTNILLFCFMYGYNQHTKIYWRNRRGQNLWQTKAGDMM